MIKNKIHFTKLEATQQKRKKIEDNKRREGYLKIYKTSLNNLTISRVRQKSKTSGKNLGITFRSQDKCTRGENYQFKMAMLMASSQLDNHT